MKILQIIPECDPAAGGPIEGIRQLGLELRKLGVEQELLTLDPPGAPGAERLEFVVHAKGRPRASGTGLLARIRRWANYSPEAVAWARAHVRDYDAVVVNGMWNYSTRLARLALVGSGVPYVVYPHGTLDPWFRKRYPHKHAIKQALWLFNEGVLLRHADAVLFTCEEERLVGRNTFWPYAVRERVVAFGAGAPEPEASGQIEAYRAMVPQLGNRRYLLFFGRIHEKKGCDLLIEAFARSADRDPDCDLVMAGPDQTGWMAELQAIAARLGIAHRLHWPGMVTGPAKFGALRGADAFVLPSHQENFGIAVAEALSCNCPVLISDQVNIWREIEEAGGGLVAPDTLAGTCDLLDRWHGLNGAERDAMAKRGAALFESRFTMAAAARELRDVLRELSI